MIHDNRRLVHLFRFCPICTVELVQSTKYKRPSVKSCPEHGDFYIGNSANKEPVVIFKTLLPGAKPQRPRWNAGRPGALIRCDQTGKLYATQKLIVDDMGVQQGNLSAHLRGDKNAKHVNGYTFTIIDPSPYIVY